MKKYNTLITKDDINGAVYIYLPPYHPNNNKPIVKSTHEVETKFGIICVDVDNLGNICGIEITNGDSVKL
jgi:uncharacterized protein YuzE